MLQQQSWWDVTRLELRQWQKEWIQKVPLCWHSEKKESELVSRRIGDTPRMTLKFLASSIFFLLTPKFKLEGTIIYALLQKCSDTKGIYLSYVSSSSFNESTFEADLYIHLHCKPQIFYFQKIHVLQTLSPPVSLSKSNCFIHH